MVTVPLAHKMVELERMSDYGGVGLQGFHCTSPTPSFPGMSIAEHLLCHSWLWKILMYHETSIIWPP